MSVREKNENLNTNKTNKKPLNDKIESMIDMIINDEKYEEGKKQIIELFKNNISNEKIINTCLTKIHNLIILKGESKHKILSIIPGICQINPSAFFSHAEIILSLFQSCMEEDNSPYYSDVSQYFGDTTKILLNELNAQKYNTYNIKTEHNQNQNANKSKKQKNASFAYTKFKNFCLSNIKSNNTEWQICGTLCLTSFIENCSLNYLNNENLKCIFDNLCQQINNPEYQGKLEILNCLISLIFCSEDKYIPYSIMTLNVIMKFIKDEEWLIRKFALNIIYTMLCYCKKEILENKEFLLNNLKSLENETNLEVKELVDQIYKTLNEDESLPNNYNNRIIYCPQNILDSNNSKSSSSEQNNNIFINVNNKEFDLCEEEKNAGEEPKPKNNVKTAREISKKKFQNSFIKNNINNNNNRNRNDKPKSRVKSVQKRRTINKYNNDFMTNKIISESSSKKLYPKVLNRSNMNTYTGNLIHNKRNVYNLSKSKNKKAALMNSVDRYYGMQEDNPITMILKKRNIISSDSNKNNDNNTSTEIHNQLKQKFKGNNDFYSIEKIKKIIAGIKNRQNDLSFQRKSKKIFKNPRLNNIKPSLHSKSKIIGRNPINKHKDFTNNTINLNRSMNDRNVLTLNQIPSFGPGSEEKLNKHIYSLDNSLEESRMKGKEKDKNRSKNKHKYSFDGKTKNDSNNKYLLNTSDENYLLNFSGNESKIIEDFENKIKNQNTGGNNNDFLQKKSKTKYHPVIQNYENFNKSSSKYRTNNDEKNKKTKRITKLKKKRSNNDYEKDSKLNLIDNKYIFSPGNELKDHLELHKLLHSFSNKDNESKGKKNSHKNNKHKNNKNDNKNSTHKNNHSLQINDNDKNNNSHMNDSKISKNKKIQKNSTNNNSNNNNKQVRYNTNNNNINIHIEDESIADNNLVEETIDDMNFELLSKNEDPIEMKFKEYKNETSKIINDLKLQVNFLKTTLGNFEENTKKKEQLNNQVKNKSFIQAFKTAVDIGNIQDIYYVIKKYQLSSEQKDIPSTLLADIMKKLCEDILSCENLRLITMFIISNICDKKIIFKKKLNKDIYNVFIDLYNKRKELCLMQKDTANILKIAKYFQN